MKEIKLEKDTIYVERKNVYGNELIYPVCKQAKLFALLSGKETLSDITIHQVKQLGYSVKEHIDREL